MALINHRAREIHFKIVYYGPSLGGKTTNLQVLHQRLPQDRRGRLLSISTDQERTLFFDFLPVELGQVTGFSTRFHLYTVPGQIYYRLSRRAVLQGLDAIVFVADSHEARERANQDSLADLWEHLTVLGFSEEQRAKLPLVFQYNKRDLHRAMPLERMRAVLNERALPEFEATANQGKGVAETLRAACKAVLGHIVHPNGTVASAAAHAGVGAATVGSSSHETRPASPEAAGFALPRSSPSPAPGRPWPSGVRPLPPRRRRRK